MLNIFKKRFLIYIILNISFFSLFLFLAIKRLLFLSRNYFFLVFIIELVILILIIFSLFYFLKTKKTTLMFIIIALALFIFSLFLLIISESFNILSYIFFLYSFLFIGVVNFNKYIKIILVIFCSFFYLIFLFIKNFIILNLNFPLNFILNITKLELIGIIVLFSSFYFLFLKIFIDLKLSKNTLTKYKKKRLSDDNDIVKKNLLLKKQNKILRSILRNLLWAKHNRKKKETIVKCNSNDFIMEISKKIRGLNRKIVLNKKSIDIYIDTIKVKNIFFGITRILKNIDIAFIKIYFQKLEYENYYMILELQNREGVFEIIRSNFSKEKILNLLIKYYKYRVTFEKNNELILIKIFITREKTIVAKYKTDYKFDIFGNKYNGGELRVYNSLIDKNIQLTKNEFNFLCLLLRRLIKEKKDTNIKDISEGYVEKKEIEKYIFGNMNSYGNRLNQMITRFRTKLKEYEIDDFLEIKNKSIRVSTSCKYYDIIIKTYR